MSDAAFELPVPVLGRWREGNTGVDGVWRFAAGNDSRAGPDVLVTALIHGNELCGAWALLSLLESGLRPRRGTLTLAFCNLQAFDRFDLAQPHASRFVDEDLNRVWGDGLAARTPTSEQRRAVELLPFVERAGWLLDLHSMHEPSVPLLLTGLQPRNVVLATRLGTPGHVVVDAGHQAGRRMRDHGVFANPDSTALSLLLECGQHGELASRDVALDMTARFLVQSDSIDAGDIPSGWKRALPARQSVLEVTDAIVARSTNLRFAEPWHGGEVVAEAGTVLGWSDGEPFRTPYADCTLIMPSLRQLRPGVTVLRLARSVDS